METNIVKRQNLYQGLKDFDVLVDESTFLSKYFNVVELPEILPQGKSSFLLGGYEFLKSNVELRLEIIDAQGNPIYTEPVLNYTEGIFSRVSVEIYSDTAPGDATLYILSQLDPVNSDVEIPVEWEDAYNVRWTRPIFIDSLAPNSEPIFFYKQPTLSINEIVKPYIVETFPTASTVVTGSLSSQSKPQDAYIGKHFKEEELIRDVIKDTLLMKLNSLESRVRGVGNYKRRGRAVRRSSPEIDKFVFALKQKLPSDTKALSNFVGGEIKIENPQIDSAQFVIEDYHEILAYSSSIIKVINEESFVPLNLVTVRDTRTDELIPVPLAEDNTFEISYPTPVTQSVSTTNFNSYAELTLDKLRTFSGDIYRVKAYVRPKGSTSDYEVLADQVIENTEILIDENSISTKDRIGWFINQGTIDNNWNIHTNFPYTVTGSLVYDSSILLDATKISGTITDDTNAILFETRNTFDFIKDTYYTLGFKAYATGQDSKPPLLDLYISGSAFGTTSVNNFKNVSQFGQKLGVLKTDERNFNWGTITHPFVADITSTGKLIF